jgi:hypothetical protein
MTLRGRRDVSSGLTGAGLQRKVVWPTDLGTFRSNGMWIRETTRRLSPLTIDRGVAGARFCMLPGRRPHPRLRQHDFHGSDPGPRGGCQETLV